MTALREHRNKQNEERLAMGKHWADGGDRDMIFTTGYGTYLRQSNLHRRHFKPLLAG